MNETPPLLNIGPAPRDYKLGPISFRTDLTPQTILGEALRRTIERAQRSGNFALARQLTQNPQPFEDNLPAMAVFMLAAEEILELHHRLDLLEKALFALRDEVRTGRPPDDQPQPEEDTP